jgi:hypothetical protein
MKSMDLKFTQFPLEEVWFNKNLRLEVQEVVLFTDSVMPISDLILNWKKLKHLSNKVKFNLYIV